MESGLKASVYCEGNHVQPQSMCVNLKGTNTTPGYFACCPAQFEKHKHGKSSSTEVIPIALLSELIKNKQRQTEDKLVGFQTTRNHMQTVLKRCVKLLNTLMDQTDAQFKAMKFCQHSETIRKLRTPNEWQSLTCQTLGNLKAFLEGPDLFCGKKQVFQVKVKSYSSIVNSIETTLRCYSSFFEDHNKVFLDNSSMQLIKITGEVNGAKGLADVFFRRADHLLKVCDKPLLAYKQYARCLQFDPKNTDALNAQALIRFRRDKIEQYTEAKDLYVKSLNIKPKQGVPLHNLGQICQKLGAKQQATSYFKKALQAFPDVQYTKKKLSQFTKKSSSWSSWL